VTVRREADQVEARYREPDATGHNRLVGCSIVVFGRLSCKFELDTTPLQFNDWRCEDDRKSRDDTIG
jgi:hypothetical protein